MSMYTQTLVHEKTAKYSTLTGKIKTHTKSPTYLHTQPNQGGYPQYVIIL